MEFRCLKKVTYQIDRKLIVAPFSRFYGKVWVNFCLNTGKRFSLANRKSKLYQGFSKWHSVWEIGMFSARITGNFKCFHFFNFQTNFLKIKNLFQKTEVPLVQITKIESAKFPHKTALSEVNVKTNRMGTKKWNNHKVYSFVRNYFIYLSPL